METNDKDSYTYFAFISHSHRDAKWATWIQEALERYRLPSAVRKAVRKPLPKRLAPVFRDATDLGTGQLVEGLHRELENSRFLIVICSPDSARPNAEGKHYVNHEIEYFAGLGRGDRVIPVIVRGTPEEAFCPKIRDLDLLAIDATKTSRARVLNDIVAKILSLRPDELWQRERRRQMMRRIELSVLGAVAGFFVAVGGLFAWDATRHVENYYADYVDSYGLPEGIFPLDKKELQGRYIHYRFEYDGIRYGKSIHADSSNWSFIRILGFRRVLRRVVQANSAGRPKEWDHTERCDRSPILEFSYNDGVLRQIVCRTSSGTFRRRLVASDSDVCVNGAVELRGAKRSLALMASNMTTTSDKLEGSGRGEIAQYQLRRDKQGRSIERRFKDVTGFKYVSDSEGVYGFAYKLDELGRTKELLYLDAKGGSRENKKGVAGRRYYYSSSNMVRIEYVSASGKSVLGPFGWKTCVDEFDELGNNIRSHFCNENGSAMTCVNGYAEGRGKYDERGNLVGELCYGTNGEPCLHKDGYAELRYEYDAYCNLVVARCYGMDKKPCLHKDGYAELRRWYDERGNIIIERFYGTDGRPCLHSGGFAELRLEYDERGNRISERYYGTDGRPCLQRDGIAEWRFEYDERGNQTSRSCYGTDEKKVLHKEGYAECRGEYDERGNMTACRYYGSDGNLCFHKDGSAGWLASYDARGLKISESTIDVNARLVCDKYGCAERRWLYDDHGNTISCRYYGTDGKLCYHKDGYAELRYEYDVGGNIIIVRNCGPDGRPCLDKYGIAEWHGAYDEQGNQTACRYYGLDGKPCLHTDGDAGWIYEYDARGLATRMVWIGVDGLPTLLRNGFAEVRCEYDAQGNMKACRYYGTDGKPCLRVDGYAGYISEYDSHGLLVSKATIGIDGQLVLNGDGFAECRCEYDAYGNIKACRFYGVDGKPILVKEGYAGWCAEHDVHGLVIRKVWLGIDGSPTLVKDEDYAEYRDGYDAYGNRILHQWYGVDGKPSLCKDGYASWRAEYDMRGNLIEERYYGTDGGLILKDGLYAVCKRNYKNYNEEIGRVYFDVEMNPIQLKSVVVAGEVLAGQIAATIGVRVGDVLCELDSYHLQDDDGLEALPRIFLESRQREKCLVIARKIDGAYRIVSFNFPVGLMGVRFCEKRVGRREFCKIQFAYQDFKRKVE